MGAFFSKFSCYCAINHNPASKGVAHDHSRGIGHCPRCELRRRAISRSSAASTSTEDLARPRYSTRYSVSPDPELIYGNPLTNSAEANAAIPRQPTPPLDRYVPARDDTDSPSSFTETTVPSRSVSPTDSMRARRRSRAEVNVDRIIGDLNRDISATMSQFSGTHHAQAGEGSGMRTPSDISQSSTVVERRPDAGRRRRSPAPVASDAGAGDEAGGEQLEGHGGRGTNRATNRATSMGRASGRMTMGQRLPRQRRN